MKGHTILITHHHCHDGTRATFDETTYTTAIYIGFGETEDEALSMARERYKKDELVN